MIRIPNSITLDRSFFREEEVKFEIISYIMIHNFGFFQFIPKLQAFEFWKLFFIECTKGEKLDYGISIY